MATPYNGIEKYIFSDIYTFFLKYKDMKNTDDNWEDCVADANNILEKYKEHPLARGIMTHTLMQLEHTVNGRKLLNLDREQWEVKLNNSHKMGW